MGVMVSLRDVIEELDILTENSKAYLNKRTGELITLSEDELSLIEDEDNLDDCPDWRREAMEKVREVLESGDYLTLPSKFDIHEYAIMEEFCHSFAGPRIRQQLLYDIKGRGAFHRFKEKIHSLGIVKDWDRFRTKAIEAIAIDWLEEHQVAYMRENAATDKQQPAVTALPSPDPDAQLVMGLMDGYRASKAVFTAVSMGVFDRLHRGGASCEELAGELNCKAHGLERILGACVALKLLTLENGRYFNCPSATRFLRVESPETFAGYILYSDRVGYRLWSHLEDAVREGTHRWEQEFGHKEGIFDHFFASEKDKQTFLAGMHGAGLLSSPAAVAAFDLTRFKHMVDLGGATGHLVIAACKRYPHLKGTVFDLPAVTPVAKNYVHQAGLDDRIQVIEGDFFHDPLPSGDLYAAGRILHDWSEKKVGFLLERIYQHLPEEGGLLICEKIVNEEKDGPASTYLQSLNMLVCTEGKERTASEYEALTRASGFKSFLARRTGQPVDAMLAVKGTY